MRAVCSFGLVIAAAAHYEKPPCASDEQLFQVSGTKGYLCAPSCGKNQLGQCPNDVPSNVTAKPECALSDPLGNKYCVLECASDSECDQAGGATCELVQPPKGVCTYKEKDSDLTSSMATLDSTEQSSGFKRVLQVTCPASCSTCQCKGCKNVTVPLGKCSAAGQGAGVIGSCNSAGTKFTEEIYFNAKCQGQSATRSVINTDACIQGSETKQYIAFFCMKSSYDELLV